MTTSNKALLGLFCLFIIVIGGLVFVVVQGGTISNNTRGTTQILEQLKLADQDRARVLNHLQVAQKQHECQTTSDRMIFATTLDLLADNFATPPFPDPDRQAAVDGMRATAAQFRMTTPACPK